MSLILFGYRVNMSAAQTPATGSFIVGYDLDGVLKQKDASGSLTSIGIGGTVSIISWQQQFDDNPNNTQLTGSSSVFNISPNDLTISGNSGTQFYIGNDRFSQRNMSYNTVSTFVNNVTESYNIEQPNLVSGDYTPVFSILKEGSEIFADTNGALDLGVIQSEVIVRIQDASQIVNQALDSTKVYVMENQITIGSGESIIVPLTGLTLTGYGFNISSIFSSAPNGTIFTSPVGGSGDLVLEKFAITTVGTGAKVFDIVDATGQHAVEFEYINFSGCKSIGVIDGYRQGTMTTAGFYGCVDGIQLAGAWNGFKITNTNIFGFGASGTFIKRAADTTFTNRLFLNLNLDFPVGAELTDFISDNLLSNELLQINSSIVKVNGTINSDISSALVPNLSANDTKCLWIGNIGLPDSAIENFVEDMAVSAFFNIDWLKDTYLLTMTGDTIFTESNLPASGKNTQEIKIYLQGDYVPTFPSDWLTNAVGTYKSTDLNEITLKFIKDGVYFMKTDNSLSVYPQPFIQGLEPTSLLPSNTASLSILGSFFTPATIVSIENQTVNSVEFINQGLLILSVTTSAIEEDVDITISNGTTVVFSGVLPINLGIVYIPSEGDWESVVGTPDLATNGQFNIVASNVNYQGTLPYLISDTQNFSFRVKYVINPIYPTGSADYLGNDGPAIFLIDATTSATIFNILPRGYNIASSEIFSGACTTTNVITAEGGAYNYGPTNKVMEFRRINGVMYFLIDNVIIYTYPTNDYTELKIKLVNENLNAIDIKYIELP